MFNPVSDILAVLKEVTRSALLAGASLLLILSVYGWWINEVSKQCDSRMECCVNCGEIIKGGE